MSPAAQQERIQSMCKTLKLDRVAVDYGGLAQTASDQQLPYSDFLEQVLGAEIAMRTERTPWPTVLSWGASRRDSSPPPT